MKIGYFADGPWAHESIAKIAEDSRFDITYIVPRFDNQDPILREWANKLEVDFLPFKDIIEDHLKKEKDNIYRYF